MKILHSVTLTLKLSVPSIICYACVYVYMDFPGDVYLRPKHVSLNFLSFLLSLTSSIYCSCGGLLVHLITLKETHTHKHTLGRTPLEEGSARRSDLYLTTHTVTTDGHPCPNGIRSRNPSKRAAGYPRFRPRGH
jgi:hypothetical protein